MADINGNKTGGKEKNYRDKYGAAHFRKVLKEQNCDPFLDLVKLIPSLPPQGQASSLIAILGYVSRKPSGTDGTGSPTAGKRNPMSKMTTEKLISALQSKGNDAKTISDPSESEE
jgi:hypothetical protein